MLTVLEAIKLSTDFLEKKGIESPRINAELLLSHVLHCKRLNLYLSFDQPLQENEVHNYRELLRRRGKAEPLQYIIGEVEFYGIQLKVNSSVLIPRPETELLVEAAIDYSRKKNLKNILDIGTGSGNIAIALAKELPLTNITAIDNSRTAIDTATANSEVNLVSDRINFRLINFPEDRKALSDNYELIVSNPPYVSGEEFNTLRPELRIYEPRTALTDNSDGLSFYRDITAAARELLIPGGALFMEMGHGQSADIRQMMEASSFTNICILYDYSGIARIISGELI